MGDEVIDTVGKAPEHSAFTAFLYPHRSLGGTGFAVLMGAVVLVSFVGGLAFALIGAWPVTGFFGLDAVLIWLAFRANYRSAALMETVHLTPSVLEVRRRHPGGREESWRLEPYWVRVELADPPEHGDQLSLTSHGRSLVIGAFLTPEERADLARALRRALAGLR